MSMGVIMNLWIFVLIDKNSNSQTSKPIGSLKSPIVDLVGEDVNEQEGTGEEGEQKGTNEDEDTSRKKKDYLRCLGEFYKEESWWEI